MEMSLGKRISFIVVFVLVVTTTFGLIGIGNSVNAEDVQTGGVIKGRVKDMSNGAALVGIEITLYGSEGEEIGIQVTDTNGKYAFNNLEDGEYTIWLNDVKNKFHYVEYEDPKYSPDKYNNVYIHVNNGNVVEVNVRMSPFFEVSGNIKWCPIEALKCPNPFISIIPYRLDKKTNKFKFLNVEFPVNMKSKNRSWSATLAPGTYKFIFYYSNPNKDGPVTFQAYNNASSLATAKAVKITNKDITGINTVDPYKWTSSKGKYKCKLYGKVLTGWNRVQKKATIYRYHFAKNGTMDTGLKKIKHKNGKYYWYYFGGANDGKMKTGWQKIKQKNGNYYRYYFGGANDGKMKTGWQKIKHKNGKYYRYYFGKDGKMKTGKVTIAGKKYVFKSNGRLS